MSTLQSAADGKGLRVAVDIGGTFTDGILQDVTTGRIWVGKCLTTPHDPGEGMSTVIAQLLEKIGGDKPSNRVGEIVHGTTLVTNTLIERKGVSTALIVTDGTEDTLDIRREVRYDLYDLHLELPEPLVPGERRFGIDERMGARGQILQPVDASRIGALAADIKASGADAVAICLLHSYVNPENENALYDALRAHLPEVSISRSSRVASEIREYERMSTTVASAYVQPIMETYLGLISERMQEAGIVGSLRIMLSSGGFTSAASAAEIPILLLESGPAAGVLSAVNTAAATGIDHVLAFDMGGTTAKACVAVDGAPHVAHFFEAARVKRFKRGSGLPILIPSIDLIEIGAGGGSMASIDALGLLKVGPQSAGAVPGPVCYGLGGVQPTVTDADLMLGYLDSESFLGGEMELRMDLCEEALADLGGKLGLSAVETAWGIVNIVNENMAAAARIHIAEKGLDPRAFTLVATGGAGPVHAVEVARKLGVTKLLFPVAAGAGSCLGLLAAPPRVDRSWSSVSLLKALDWDQVARVVAGLREDAEHELVSAGADISQLEWMIVLEMRYVGQGGTVAVSLPYGPLSEELVPTIMEEFAGNYRKLYGDISISSELQVTTWRLTGSMPKQSHRFYLEAHSSDTPEEAIKKRRKIYLPDHKDYGVVPVYDRYALAPGSVVQGPLVLEERESTLVVAAVSTVTILDDLTVSVSLGE